MSKSISNNVEEDSSFHLQVDQLFDDKVPEYQTTSSKVMNFFRTRLWMSEWLSNLSLEQVVEQIIRNEIQKLSPENQEEAQMWMNSDLMYPFHKLQGRESRLRIEKQKGSVLSFFYFYSSSFHDLETETV